MAQKSRPCRICHRWFLPDPRVKARQRVCSAAACQAERRKRTQAAWREDNADYAVARRLKERAAPEEAGAAPRQPLRLFHPLNKLPWDIAKDEFGAQGADFIAVLGQHLVRHAKDQT